MSGNDINGQELGWISLHRKLKNHWLWQDPVKLKWWLDILLSVNHVPAKVNIGNEIIECGKGQSVRSLQTWAYEWKTSKDTARNFLKLLEKDGMVKLENVVKSTRLTVCNYDSYQGKLHADQTQTKRVPNADQTQTHPNNNEDNKNKENKEIITPAEAAASFDSASVEKVAAPQKKFSFEDKYRYFIAEIFNSLTGKKCKGDVKSKAAFKARLAEGYTSEDFKAAIKACLADDFHKEKGYKHLTPEFITRSDKLEKFLNHAKVIPIGSMENKRAAYVPKPPMSDEEYNALFPVGKVEIKRENLIKFGFAI